MRASDARIALMREKLHGYSSQDFVNWGRSATQNITFGAGGGAPPAFRLEQLARGQTLDKVPTTWNVLLFADFTQTGATAFVQQVVFTLLIGCGSAKKNLVQTLSLKTAAPGPAQFIQLQNIPAETLDIMADVTIASDTANTINVTATAMVAPVFI